MFNTQAFVSTILFLTFLALIYIGALCYLFHRWKLVQVFGVILATASFAAIMSHLTALIAGV